MSKLPPQIATPNSGTEITRRVKRLLKAAEVSNQLPTPKSQVIACAELAELGEIDLAEYEASLADSAVDYFHKAISKVLGFLDRRTESIYVDPQIKDSRRLFVTYHEVIHRILDWQNIFCTEDEESTLSAECNTIFEAEANFGAAEILFQCDRFENEARDYNLSVASALHLAERYDASC